MIDPGEMDIFDRHDLSCFVLLKKDFESFVDGLSDHEDRFCLIIEFISDVFFEE